MELTSTLAWETPTISPEPFTTGFLTPAPLDLQPLTTSLSRSDTWKSHFNPLLKFADAVADQVAERKDVPNDIVSTFFSYLISPYALVCVSMAVILNRTVVFANSRIHRVMPLPQRLLLRCITIYFLLKNIVPLLVCLKYSAKLQDKQTLFSIIPDYFNLGPNDKVPSPDLFWYLYLSICLGQFIETFASVIQGRTPYSEAGMSLFEYSMAFQEAQFMESPSIELLSISLFSAVSQLSVHLFGILNLNNYRLIPSSIFGLSFLIYFATSVFNGTILKFPAVCIIGYFPQLLTCFIILLCLFIYTMAAIFAGGRNNLSTNLNSIHFSMDEDYYSCLMKLGVVSLTSASKIAYLNESASIQYLSTTWLDAELQNKLLNNKGYNKSPYSRESLSPPEYHSTGQLTFGESGETTTGRGSKRRRFFLTWVRVSSAYKMIKSICSIFLKMISTAMLKFWNFISQKYGFKNFKNKNKNNRKNSNLNLSDSKLKSEHKLGNKNNNQKEIRAYLSRHSYMYNDNNLSTRDLLGPDLPDYDPTPEYQYNEDSDYEDGYEYDSEYASDSDIEEIDRNDSESIKTGYMGSVQLSHQAMLRSPLPKTNRMNRFQKQFKNQKEKNSNAIVLELFNAVEFTRLIAPITEEDHHSQTILAMHLSQETNKRLTRSQFQTQLSQKENNESDELIRLINSRRPRKHINDGDDEDLGINEENCCAVCHVNQRQIVLWPCRCFAICEECRMALAMRNFNSCVCCRRDVESFSRIFSP